MAASAHPAADDDKALIECSLCLSTFQQPKCLPCSHTFCLDCLQKYVDQNDFSDKLPCPLCRQEFTIPPQGLSSLPNDFYILNMIELQSKSGNEAKQLNVEMRCDVCLDKYDRENCPAASKYCPECNQNMCKSCIDCHGKLNGTKSHTPILLSERAEASASFLQNRPSLCEKHKSEPICLYCLKCDVCVCRSCMSEEHNEHKCEDIRDAFTRYLDQFDVNISKLQGVLTVGEKSVQKLKDTESEIVRESSVEEQKIRERCDELRKMLDSYEEELLCGVRKFREERVKEVKSQLDQVEFHKVQLESFVSYLRGLKENGSNYDVTSSGKELITRAEHLLVDGEKVFIQELTMTRIKFFSKEENCGVKNGRTFIGGLTTEGKLLIILGLGDGSLVKQEICEIRLDQHHQPDKINVINSTPAQISNESAACVIGNVLYAVCIGGAYNELWAWSASRDEWTRYADMSSAGRRRHCVTSVGDKIYVLGGYVDSRNRTLDTILCYDINSNKWSKAGKLCHAVHSATCVTYKQHVYVFGGTGKDNKSVNHVQVYNTTTGTVSLASNPMPAAYNLMRAVLWRSKALLIGQHTCYIYEFESSTWQERKRFKTDVYHFGLSLDDNTLYISGGGTRSDAGVWTYRADVKSLSVDDFISDNKEVEWKHHATLPTPALVQAYSSTPCICNYYVNTN